LAAVPRPGRKEPATIATLIGLTVGMAISGLIASSHRLGLPLDLPGTTLIGLCLIPLAVGVRIPQRFAVWLCLFARQQIGPRRGGMEVDMALLVRRPIDRSLHWTVFGVISLLAGLSIAVTPLLLSVLESIWDVTAPHFVWSDIFLHVAIVLLVMVGAFPAFGFLGLGCSCAHHLMCRNGRWDAQATGWLLLGAALGSSIVALLESFNLPPSVILVASALPPLGIAAAAAGVIAGDDKQGKSVRPTTLMVPESGDRWSALTRFGTVSMAAASATLICLVSASALGGIPSWLPVVVPMLFALGAGALLAAWRRHPAAISIGGFGASCGMAGVATASVSFVDRHTGAGGSALLTTLVLIALFLLGYAVVCGKVALLRQVGNRTSAGTSLLVGILLWSGAAMMMVVPVALGYWDILLLFAAVGMGMIALGGTLVIHEPHYHPVRRRVRLAAIFCAIGLMITMSLIQA
jgi:hypothetical protein